MQGLAQQPDRGGMLGQQGVTGDPVADGGELEHHREVVGQLLVADREAAGRVGLLEPQDRHPAVAGVPVGPVGQERARPALHVEDLDVVPLHVTDRGAVQVREELRQWGPHRIGQLGHGGGQAVEAIEQRTVRVGQQPGARQPGGGDVTLGHPAHPEPVDRRLRPAQAQREPEELRGLPTADPGQRSHDCTSSASERRIAGHAQRDRAVPVEQVHPGRSVLRGHVGLGGLSRLEGVEVLHGDRHRPPGGLAERTGRAELPPGPPS